MKKYSIMIGFCFTTVLLLPQLSFAQITISDSSIDAGAGVFVGGNFVVSATIGQHDASLELTGGSFSLTGGVATGKQADIVLGDANGDGAVNLLDVGPFIDLIADGGYQLEADINQDGFVNLLDVGPFIELLSG